MKLPSAYQAAKLGTIIMVFALVANAIAFAVGMPGWRGLSHSNERQFWRFCTNSNHVDLHRYNWRCEIISSNLAIVAVIARKGDVNPA